MQKRLQSDFCNSLISAGTVGAVIYSSSHCTATDVLFETLEASGLKALAGMTLMNREAPDELLCNTEKAISDMNTLIHKWHGHDNDRLRYCITPRSAISCTADLLQAAGEMANEHQLWIQTHLSENKNELITPSHSFLIAVII